MAHQTTITPRVATLTISDTRTAADDHGGALLGERLRAAGAELVSHSRVTDDPAAILAAVRALDLGRGGGGGGGCGGGSGGRKKGVGDAERQEQEQEQALFGARVALVLCCSQKALAVAVPVVAALFASSSSSSLSSSTPAATASIPMIILHTLQTAFDGLVAARVAKRRERE